MLGGHDWKLGTVEVVATGLILIAASSVRTWYFVAICIREVTGTHVPAASGAQSKLRDGGRLF